MENRNTCSQVDCLELAERPAYREQGLADVCLAWTSLALHLAHRADPTVDSVEQEPWEGLCHKGRREEAREGREAGKAGGRSSWLNKFEKHYITL